MCAEPHPNSRGRGICFSRKVSARESRQCLLRAMNSDLNSASASQQMSWHHLHMCCTCEGDRVRVMVAARPPHPLAAPSARRAGCQAAGAPGSASPKQRLSSSGQRQKFTSCFQGRRLTGWEILHGIFFFPPQEQFANSRGLLIFGQLMGAGKMGTALCFQTWDAFWCFGLAPGVNATFKNKVSAAKGKQNTPDFCLKFKRAIPHLLIKKLAGKRWWWVLFRKIDWHT